MAISSLSNTTAASGTGTSTGSSNNVSDPQAAQDRFLKLLVAQMNNQDPMNPMDNAQMTSQIAQINTVTGIQQLNETVKNMASQFTSMQLMQGTALVGHSVVTEGNTLTQTDGVGQGMFELPSAAANVSVTITTAGGQTLGTVALGSLAAGQHSFEWDASAYADRGPLSFKVSAMNGNQAVRATTLTKDKVIAASPKDGGVTLQLQNGASVNYSQIKSVL